MFKKYTIKEQECGYLMKNGKFVKLITAGRYTYAKFLGYEVLKVPMSGEVNTCGIPEEVLMKDTGASGVMRKGETVQVVYGLQIGKIRQAVDQELGLEQ